MAYRRKHYHNDPYAVLIGAIVLLICLAAIPTLTLLNSNDIVLFAAILGLTTIVVGGGLLLYIAKEELKRLRALKLADIDNMSGIEFERYVGEVLKFQDFKIEYTPPSNDFGVDIVASKDGNRYAIQMKRYTHTVDRKAIADAVGGMKMYNCNKTMVVTNSYFTSKAVMFAKVNDCELVDRRLLSKWIVAFQEATKLTKLPARENLSSTNPQDWASGSEQMTEKQYNYLALLCRETGTKFDSALTKAQASQKIEELEQRRGKTRQVVG